MVTFACMRYETKSGEQRQKAIPGNNHTALPDHTHQRIDKVQILCKIASLGFSIIADKAALTSYSVVARYLHSFANRVKSRDSLLLYRLFEMAPSRNQLYAVENILACKRVGGKFLYRIRWSGYGAADDTWEEADSFTSAALSHFKRRMIALEKSFLDSKAGAKRRSREQTAKTLVSCKKASVKRTRKPSKAKAKGQKAAARKNNLSSPMGNLRKQQTKGEARTA
ncbi:hypothetical protein Efla_003298 [Eimeria flavescens]